MEEEKSHIHYSAEYIRKYLEGELSAVEMLALEKAALEDPFLSDAIEGYEESHRHPGSFESGVEALQKRLAQRIAEKDLISVFVRKITKWQVAASLLFILGAALFSVIILNKNRKAELADRIAKDNGINSKLDTTVSANTRSLPVKVHVNRVAKIYPPAKESAETAAGQEERAIKREEQHREKVMDESDSARLYFSSPTDSSMKKAAAVAAVKISEQAIEGPKPERAMASRNVSDTVAGWAAFSQFINNNKKIVTADSLLKGDEIISFLVSPDGNLTSFKIVKSISPAHDAEIFRLIKLAPALKPLEDKKQKCQLTISFK